MTVRGYFTFGAGSQIANSGVIKTEGDGAAGIIMLGDGHHLTNSGKITTDGGAFLDEDFRELSAAGVLVSGDDALVENTRTGVIESTNIASSAVELNVLESDGVPNADLSARLENSGLIKGAAIAVLGGAGQETVINHGSIVGDVFLGAGADQFVFGKGGSLAGQLFLGDGNDIVRIENGSGASQIDDFETGHDVINVSAFFSNFSQVVANSTDSSGGMVITLDNNDELTLLGVHALNASDFSFV